ncbi:carbohydrate kinase family protein [Candidatus Roizmanbacteria bacterium]|nr:carbohydrate kinase family protein [Candidatus Roizmanbacteria bacterium]
MKNIILTGSLAYDYIFDVDDYFSKYILPNKIHQINISVITDEYKKSLGGTAGNQAFYLARLGLSPNIFATAGKDFQEYKSFLKKNGINAEYIKIIPEQNSAAGFGMTDKKDNQIWMYSKGAMINNSKLILSTIVDKLHNSFVIISPNDPQAIINFVNQCEKEDIEFAFDPAFYIPTLPQKTLFKGVKNARIIFGNDYEIAFLEKRLRLSLPKLINKNQIIVKTLGDQGSEIFKDGKWQKVGIYKVKPVDPTGAGDAYRAGFLYGYLNNQPIKTCGWMGAVTASFAVEVKGTMNLKFSKQQFEKRLKSVYG